MLSMKKLSETTMIFVSFKVKSVQEACAKCFAVHILKFEILQITWRKWNKEHQTLSFQFFINKSSILMLFVLFFMWFARFHILICEPQSIWANFLYWVAPTWSGSLTQSIYLAYHQSWQLMIRTQNISMHKMYYFHDHFLFNILDQN